MLCQPVPQVYQLMDHLVVLLVVLVVVLLVVLLVVQMVAQMVVLPTGGSTSVPTSSSAARRK